MNEYFERLFTEEVSWVHRTLIRLGVAPRDAEDGAQEVFTFRASTTRRM